MAYGKGRDNDANDEVLGRGVVRLYVSFSPNGSSNVSLTNQQKKKGLRAVTAVGSGGAGLVNVQLDRNYHAVLDSGVHVRTTDNTNNWTGRVVDVWENSSNGTTLRVCLYKNDTATNIVSATGNVVTMALVMSKSSIWN